jgi:Pvc16 N-terminal domain/IPT/TIG domain
MALSETALAIRRVTELVKFHLEKRIPKLYTSDTANFTVTVGRPEPGTGNPGLNLFLYEALFDASLKNVSLAEGQQPPLWLVLRYLITPYTSVGSGNDNKRESDTLQALGYLGMGVRVLQEMNWLEILASDPEALSDNPEPLKLTFNEASVDLLSKLMQGGDEKYRLSMAFEIRPVMIAGGEPPALALPVGIDFTQTPAKERTEPEKGVLIDVIPHMRPVINSVSPSTFEVNDTVTVLGSNLDQAGLSIFLGDSELPVTMQQPGKLQFKVNGAVAAGNMISAGNHPLKVVKTLSFGRMRSSNLVPVNLIPTLVDPGLITPVTPLIPENHPYDTGVVVTGSISLTGTLLGTQKDDIIATFYKDGETTGLIDVNGDSAPTQTQTGLTVNIEDTHLVPQGEYRVILMVNGQQAVQTPLVELTV